MIPNIVVDCNSSKCRQQALHKLVVKKLLHCLDCNFASKPPSAKKMPLEQVWLKSEHSLHAYTFDYVKDCKCGYAQPKKNIVYKSENKEINKAANIKA